MAKTDKPVEATPAAPDARRPDALLLPDDGRWGSGVHARGNAICDYAEPILGGQAHGRKLAIPGKTLVTTSPHDTYLVPPWHRLAGRDRYRWEDGENGVRLGYLVDGAPTAAEIEAGNKEAFGS
jgi:hypothetical protein